MTRDELDRGLDFESLRTKWKGMMHRKKLGQVAVCPEWEQFENYVSYLIGLGFEKGMRVHRLNGRQPFQPGNIEILDEETYEKRKDEKRNSYRIKMQDRIDGICNKFSKTLTFTCTDEEKLKILKQLLLTEFIKF